MADSLIQSALTLPKIRKIDAANALKPGSTLTSPNPSGGLRIESGLGIRDYGVDVVAYARRDSELQWRDISVAKAVEMVARRASTVFGSSFEAPQLPFEPEVISAESQTATLAISSTSYSVTLDAKPVVRSQVEVIIDAVRTVDDGRGKIVAQGFIVSGTIDYVTGAFTLVLLPDLVNTRSLTINYGTVSYLDKSVLDLNPDQLTFTQGGVTGVKYVTNQSTPEDAVTSDQDLYRRDLVLYQVLSQADQIFTGLVEAWSTGSSDPTVPQMSGGASSPSGAPAIVTQAWSRAEAKSEFKLPDFGKRWGPETFADPDKYNAWRDNILAFYAAELSRRLAFIDISRADLQGIGTEDGVDIRVGDSTTTVDSATPSGAGVDSEVDTIVLPDAVSQLGLSVTSTSDSISLMKVGDKIVWNSTESTVFELVNATTVKAFPSHTVALATAHIERNVTIFDPPRVLRVNPPVWAQSRDGLFGPIATAQRLYVRVKDTQLTNPTLGFSEVTLDWNPAVGPQETVLRFYDTEYKDANGLWSLARVPRAEAEIYQLISEDSRFRIFAAQPYLPNNTRAIVFDSVLNTTRWYPHLSQDFVMPAPAAPKLLGFRQSQEVELLAIAPYGPDAEHWRQLAAQVQATPCHERTIEYRNYPPGSTPFAYFQADSGAQVVTGQPTIFTTAGITRYAGFPVYAPVTESRSQWVQFNFLIEPAKTWYRHGNTWSSADSIGAVSVGSTGMVFPPASSSNSFQLIGNSPRGAWKLNLPVGSYTVAFDWVDLNSSPVPLLITIRLGTQILFSGEWNGTFNTAILSDEYKFAVSNSDDVILTLSLNSPVTGQGIRINRFKLTQLGSPVPVDYRVNVSFYDTDPAVATEPPIPTQYARFRGITGLPDVLSTGWIDIDTVGLRSVLNCQIELLDQPEVPFAIKGVELRTRIRIEPITNWALYVDFKEHCLAQAIEGIQAKYSIRVQPDEIREVDEDDDTKFIWTSDVTTLWMDEIASEETRLSSAFRPARPGDIGRPALVPAGVYFDGEKVAALLGPVDATPTLAPWQPWMMSLGFLVAMEDFWSVEEPSRPVKLTIIDPTGEDVVNFDPNAPNLDFTKPRNSQYVPLI